MRAKADLDKLLNKYKINIKKIIFYWQLGKSDEEICQLMNIERDKLTALRYELQQSRWQETIKRRKVRTKHIIL